MGAVWVAHHLDLEVDVAMKFMLGDLADDPTVRQRFAREAKAAAKIKSPHVTQIHDYGVHEGTPYMAMELLEGRDLDDVVLKREELGIDRVAEIVTQLCRGLSVAHEAGVIHRDLKPSNVFLVEMGDQPLVKVLDFGIAKVVRPDLAVSKGTESGVLVGSPRYMSPEQATGEPLDGRSDLWSVGVVIYELLTGVSPFDAESLGKVITLICTADIPPPSHYDRRLGAEVDRFFDRAFERDPERRFQSAMELADAFASVVSGEPMPASVDPLARTDEEGAADQTLGGTLDLPPDTQPIPADTSSASTKAMTAKTAPMVTPAPVSTDSRRPAAPDDEASPVPSRNRARSAMALGAVAALVGVVVWASRGEPHGPSEGEPAAGEVADAPLDPGSPELPSPTASASASATSAASSTSRSAPVPLSEPEEPPPVPKATPRPKPVALPPPPAKTAPPAPAPPPPPAIDPRTGLPITN